MRTKAPCCASALVLAILARPPALKAWETQGTPRLLVIAGYRMGFRIAPQDTGSLLGVFIDFALPGTGLARWLGRALGPAYARWCCRQMLRDAQRAFSPAATAAPNRP